VKVPAFTTTAKLDIRCSIPVGKFLQQHVGFEQDTKALSNNRQWVRKP
jgi:hypothetical protein